MPESKLIKIILVQTYEDDEPSSEAVWAEPLGGNKYRVKNYPIYCYGVSFDDVVNAEKIFEESENPYFTHVIEKSGHKTIRIILNEDRNDKASILDKLVEMGCDYEGVDTGCYFSVDVRPTCNLESISNFLIERGVQFEYADPTYDQLFDDAVQSESKND